MQDHVIQYAGSQPAGGKSKRVGVRQPGCAFLQWLT